MYAQSGKPKMFKVVAPVQKKDGTKFWMRVGTGFPGKDPTSFNLILDAFPTEGKLLHVREMDDEDFQRGDRGDRGDRGADRRVHEPMPAAANDLPF